MPQDRGERGLGPVGRVIGQGSVQPPVAAAGLASGWYQPGSKFPRRGPAIRKRARGLEQGSLVSQRRRVPTEGQFAHAPTP